MFKGVSSNDETKWHVKRLEGIAPYNWLNTIDVDTGLSCKGCTLNGLMQVQKETEKLESRELATYMSEVTIFVVRPV